tara:strand:+ start:487 stop:2703 length:2217 start_codon:yes stop_codon:yes gene_type:complete
VQGLNSRSWIVLICLLIGSSGCQTTRFNIAAYEGLGDQYDVTIRRDLRGVPHILGKSNPDVAFGLAYAHAEDAWPLIEEAIPFYRGENGRYVGPDGAITDYLVEWLGIWETIEANYIMDLSPDARAYIQAYADGLNFYASQHPDAVDLSRMPVTAYDLVAGSMLRHLLFYGFDHAVEELFEETRQSQVSAVIRPPKRRSEIRIQEPEGLLIEPPEVLKLGPGEIKINGLPVGSNAFAIMPGISDEGATRLAINSHQPTTGPVAWYEARLKSDEGLDVMGGLFPGSPSINVGFTRDLAWGATVNNPDLVDIFVLDINPENENQYRLDGEWLDLEVREVEIGVTLWGFLPWTVTREVLRSAHGPAIRTPHGTYAVRYAGMGEIRQLEQWMLMNLATSFDEWVEAMRVHSFASFNFVYADREGNIMFLHNALTPRRDARYDWSQYLPGDDASLIWKDYLPFGRLPQVINPQAGYVHSANQTPFRVTDPADDPSPESFPLEHGFQQNMTNRAHRGLELFQSLGPSISEAEFSAIKHDKVYSRSTDYVSYLEKIQAQQFDDPKRQEAQSLLAQWNLSTDVENPHAALGTCVFLAAEKRKDRSEDGRQEVGALLDGCIDTLLDAEGRLDPRWGDRNRHVRGDVNVPVGGGPDILRAIYGRDLNEDGYLTNVAGDGLYYLVSWQADGTQKVEGVHHFGSATQHPESPHYDDQAEAFAEERLHEPAFDEALLQAQLSRAYRPGQEE